MIRPVVSRAAEIRYAKLYPHTLEDEQNEWQLLRYIDATTTPLFEVPRFIISDDGDRPGWAILFDVEECPVEHLSYLAQFAGVELDAFLNEEEQRIKIKERPASKRGTVGAMKSAARRRLIGSETVVFYERFEGNAYRLLVRTYTQDTPDPVGTEKDLREQKPAGIVLDYECVVGKIYATMKAEFATYAIRTARGLSYADSTAP